MKIIASLLVTVFASCFVSAQDIKSIPILPESNSPFDFRGEPEWDYPPYKKLFETKTYGELLAALQEFGKHWNEDQASHKGVVASNAYYTCKQAMIRLLYLSDEAEEADRLLEELHPRHHLKGEDAQKLLAANIEKDRIRRVAAEIRVLYMEMASEDPYPNGIPATIHELYRPLFKMLRELGGG